MAGIKSLAPGLAAGGTVLQTAGYLDAARATKQMAVRRKQAAEFAALQLEQNAGQELAAGQMGAEEARRQGKILGSNILARAAASGGGASDPTVVNLIAKTAGEASYRAALASYQGEAAARHLNLQAAGQRYGADLYGADASSAAQAMKGRALQTALISGGSLYGKYWAGPKGDDPFRELEMR